MELAEYAGSNFVRFVGQVLSRAAAAILEAIVDLIEDIERQVEQWINDIEAAAQALFDAIADIAREIAELIEEVQARFDEALDMLEDTLRELDRPSGRARLLDKLAYQAGEAAVAVLRSIYLYKGLSLRTKRRREAWCAPCRPERPWITTWWTSSWRESARSVTSLPT